MAAITGILFIKKIALGGAVTGGLIGEIWRVPASAAADTQTLVCRYITNVLAVIGNAQYTAPTAGSIPALTLDTVAASSFADILIIGTAV